MSKRQERPWESASYMSSQMALAQAVLEAPSVTVDGTRYWSDRFYLNHVDGDPLPSSNNSGGGCTCGAKQAPPLMSRERLVQSLDVKAAILGTFTLDTAWLVEAFPQLVGPKATVPTLIIHGAKKFNQERRMAEEHENDSDEEESSSFFDESPEQENSQPSSVSSHTKQKVAATACSSHPPLKGNNTSIPLVEFSSSRLATSTTTKDDSCEESSSSQGALSLQTQAQVVSSSKSTEAMAAHISLANTTTPKSGNANGCPPVVSNNVEGTQSDASRHTTVTPEANTVASSSRNDIGKFCSFTYILSAWNKPKEAANTRVSYEPVESHSSKSTSSTEFKRGVHHPKFMILFETSGNVVVLVSTANLTKTQTIEGTWVQRFGPNRRYQQHQQRLRQQSSAPLKSTPPPAAKRNDFGLVLQDFLEKLDGSAFEGDTKVHDFLHEQLGFPLLELAQSFQFEKAQVHLVPVVPGDWEDTVTTTKKTTPKKQPPFSYGRQRVHDILQRENSTLLQSNTDRLIVQPTSFGGNWQRDQMADVVRSYLNVSQQSGSDNDDSIDYWDDAALLERMDIVWPSRTYIINANRSRENQEPLSTQQVESLSHEDTELEASWVFLSSNTFNSCDRSSISRLARFQISDPPQRPTPLVPHFKSIGRLVTKHSLIRRHGFDPSNTAREYLSWFLLTSACLSQGAQGKRIRDTDPFSTSKEKVQYANFELGVLFTSRIQPREKRLYGFAPHQCSCHQPLLNDLQQKLIHLPIPYSLQPKPFLEDQDDNVMQETPFFHEIDDGTRCVGNMLLTPYGIQEAKKRNVG